MTSELERAIKSVGLSPRDKILARGQHIIEDDCYVTVWGHCVFSKEKYSVTLMKDQWAHWNSGQSIQSAAPELPLDDREFLISGISPKGWEQTFKGEY